MFPRREAGPVSGKRASAMAGTRSDVVPLAERALHRKEVAPSVYNKALVRGRDPRSFPQNADVWRFVNRSTLRTRKVKRGAHLFGAVDEEQVLRAREQLHDGGTGTMTTALLYFSWTELRRSHRKMVVRLRCLATPVSE